MALSSAAIRAIAIRRSKAKRAQVDTAENDNQVTKMPRRMSRSLLQVCVDAGGYDQNARFA